MVMVIIPVSPHTHKSPLKGKQRGRLQTCPLGCPRASQNQLIHREFPILLPHLPHPNLHLSLYLLPQIKVSLQITAPVRGLGAMHSVSLTPHLPGGSCLPPLNRHLKCTKLHARWRFDRYMRPMWLLPPRNL